MKKLSLIALLAAVTLGVVACGNPNSSSEAPSTSSAPSTSETVSSEPASSEEASSEEASSELVSSEEVSSEPVSSETEEVATLPAPWGEGATYANSECSVSLVPGSIKGQAETVKPVSEFLTEKIRFIDLRDPSEGYSEGHVGKFESISYFNLIVGKGEAANTTLFKLVDGEYVPNYEESEFYLNKMFPKDQTLFLMCAVGGRVTPFIQLLDQYDYDMTKVYNVGGWNQVNAAENYAGYSVSLGLPATAVTYDFSALTPVEA